jgi:hypothetical protein
MVKVNSDLNLIEILRPGRITKKDLQEFLLDKNINYKIVENFNAEGPGSMKEHYQPHSPLYLFVNRSCQQSDLKSFSSPKVLDLPKDPVITARLIYKYLIEFSEHHDALILNWSDKKDHPLWDVILNRLEKAATQII